MSHFYCRENELQKLNKRYAGNQFECIVIYGRRRVGKTALINEFCKDKPTIFFSALNTTGKENLASLSKSIMSFERPDMESAPEFKAGRELTGVLRDDAGSGFTHDTNALTRSGAGQSHSQRSADDGNVETGIRHEIHNQFSSSSLISTYFVSYCRGRNGMPPSL